MKNLAGFPGEIEAMLDTIAGVKGQIWADMVKSFYQMLAFHTVTMSIIARSNCVVGGFDDLQNASSSCLSELVSNQLALYCMTQHKENTSYEECCAISRKFQKEFEADCAMLVKKAQEYEQ